MERPNPTLIFSQQGPDQPAVILIQDVTRPAGVRWLCGPIDPELAAEIVQRVNGYPNLLLANQRLSDAHTKDQP